MKSSMNLWIALVAAGLIAGCFANKPCPQINCFVNACDNYVCLKPEGLVCRARCNGCIREWYDGEQKKKCLKEVYGGQDEN